MNRTKNYNAIILKSKKINEIDKLLYIFSPILGVVKATAFGSSKINSRFQGKIEQFSLILAYIYNKNDDFYTLKEVQLEEKFDNLVSSINKIFIANLFCEIILKCSTGNEDEKIFNLLYNSLFCLNSFDKNFDDLILINFILRYLFWIGFYAFEKECSVCEKNLKDEEYLSISKNDFTISCTNCADGDVFIIDKKTYNYIDRIMHLSLKDSLSIQVEKSTIKHLKDILISQLKFISNQNFKSLENFL